MARARAGRDEIAKSPALEVIQLSTHSIGINMNPNQQLALERLIAIAKRDTGQCRRVADFLLSWWNAEACGGWDVTDLWSLDAAIVRDVFVVLAFMAHANVYPDRLGYETDFQAILKQWRPELLPSADHV